MLKELRCKSCTCLLAKAQVFVGVIKCKRCGHTAEYRLLTDSFIKAVQEGDIYEHDHADGVHNHNAIALA